MSLTAVALVLLSAAIHVGWNYLTKSSASPKAFSLLKGVVMSGISLMVLAAMPLRAVPAFNPFARENTKKVVLMVGSMEFFAFWQDS